MARKPSAYMIFSNEKRAEVKEQNPGARVTVIAKRLGEMWRALSEEEKSKYKEDAKNAPAYEPKAKKPKREKKSRKTRALNADGTPKPKREPSSYIKFANSKRAEVKEAHPGLKVTEIAKKLGEMWRGLSDDEKKAYK